MYKLIIIDDEAQIRAGLKNIIEWEVFGSEVEAEFDNGMNAYLYLKENPVDMVLLDINMPGMTGIELLELCSHLQKRPFFIILSGYNDFEYVRDAMRHGARNYLLKPIDQEELTNTILSVIQELDDIKTQSRQFEEIHIALKNDIILRLLTGRIDTRELREKSHYANLSFRSSNMRLALFKLIFTANDKHKIYWDYSIIHFCENFCNHTCKCYAAIDDKDNLILILKESTQALSENDYNHLIKMLLLKLKERISVNIVTVLSEHISKIPEFPAAYKSCVQLAERKDIMQSLFQKDTIKHFEANSSHGFSYTKMIQCLERQDTVAIKKILHAHFAKMIPSDDSYNFEYIKYQLIEFIIYSLQELKSSLIADSIIEAKKEEGFQVIKSSETFSELEERLLTFFISLAELLNNENKTNYSPPVQSAHNYVRKNYQDSNLSLKTLAAQMHINAAYLGRQFSTETKEYFSDYLNRIRISKAIHFLNNSDFKMTAIAEKVGFANTTYFYTIFKKYTGKSPSDYRGSGGR